MRRYVYTAGFAVYVFLAAIALDYIKEFVSNSIEKSIVWLIISSAIFIMSIIDSLDNRVIGKIIDIICGIVGMIMLYVSICSLTHALTL